MVRTKIGEAVTDENGIAVFEYTGTGSGLMDVRAVNGDVVSQTYTVMDCLIHGITISDWNLNSDTSYELIDGKHTFTTHSETVGNKISYLTTLISGDFHIEFNNFNSLGWTPRIRVYSPSENKYNSYSMYNQSDATFIIERVNGVFSATLNGNAKTTEQTQLDFSSDVILQFVLYINSSSSFVLDFEDLKIYSI